MNATRLMVVALLVAFSSVEERAWGAYVAFVGLAVYAGAFFADILPTIRGRYERRAMV